MARQPNFDFIARSYRWLEYLSFGPFLESCRFHYLNQLGSHSRALILGDGDGRFTVRLLAANPKIVADAVDSSAAMLNLLSRRVARLGPGASERLTTIHSDALAFQPVIVNYDLVVTHFFFDCLTDRQVDALVANLRPRLTCEATWLVSEFAIPERRAAALPGRAIIAVLYFAFGIFTGLTTRKLPDYASTLQRAGFVLLGHKPFLGGLLQAQLWQLGSTPKN